MQLLHLERCPLVCGVAETLTGGRCCEDEMPLDWLTKPRSGNLRQRMMDEQCYVTVSLLGEVVEEFTAFLTFLPPYHRKIPDLWTR